VGVFLLAASCFRGGAPISFLSGIVVVVVVGESD